MTELVARPLVALLFPDLAGFAQPLAGECAGRRGALEAVPFVGGYGVDLGLLVDMARRFGLGAMAQCDLGTRVHRNRPLSELGPQALAVMQLAFERAGIEAPGFQDGRSVLDRPLSGQAAVSFEQLPALSGLAAEARSARGLRARRLAGWGPPRG